MLNHHGIIIVHFLAGVATMLPISNTVGGGMRFFSLFVPGVIVALLSVSPAGAGPLLPGNDKPGANSSSVPPWPRLDDEEQAKAVAGLKEYAETTAAQLNFPLRMFETKYFLFYSDLPEKEAQKWAGLLDKMYDRLAELFGVQKGENIWRGKGLVFVFSKADAYQKYERDMLHTDPTGTAGMCHSSPNGFVRIAFYRQADEGMFAHVLVHESVHGFIHRYRTPVLVPNWTNEGLAETIATELVPQTGRFERVKNSARQWLKLHDSHVGDFFSLEHIEGWQYPVAETMCTYMIQSNKKKYVGFIRSLKDGVPWEQSLTNEYGLSTDRLLQAFGQWLGVRDLKQ